MRDSRQAHIPDQRTLAFHQKAADILNQDPQRLIDVHKVLDNWLKLNATQSQEWAERWKKLINGLNAVEIAALIVQEGELADYYRKSSPFPALLSEKDRLNILYTYKFEYEKGTS